MFIPLFLAFGQIVFMRFIYVVEYNSWSYFVAVYYSIVCTEYIIQFIHFTVDGHVGCFSLISLKAILLRTFFGLCTFLFRNF